MRKIEQQMLDAVTKPKSFRKDNTQVIVSDKDPCVVELHGHEIARVYQGSIAIRLANWDTNLTRSRLRALLNGLGLDQIQFVRHRGVTYLHGDPMNPNQWYHINL